MAMAAALPASFLPASIWAARRHFAPGFLNARSSRRQSRQMRARSSQSDNKRLNESTAVDADGEDASVWDTKPFWCQPWSIVLTGVLAVTASWLVLKSVPAALLVSILVAAWWYIFLYSYPMEYRNMRSKDTPK